MNESGPVMPAADFAGYDPRRFRVVAIIAAVVALPFALTHLGVGLFVLPTLQSMYGSMGGELPAILQVFMNAQSAVGPLLFAIDVGIFIGFYFLARRLWIGFLFVPPLVYLAIGQLLISIMYMPVFSTITLVQ
jgi:hypothetical protein